MPRLSDQLELDELWDALGECLIELAKAPDHHAVLVLQPAVEAFFIVHAGMYIKLVTFMNCKLFPFWIVLCMIFASKLLLS